MYERVGKDRRRATVQPNDAARADDTAPVARKAH
jgi:hypothetical protein